ncbi:MAG: conserved membrane protein of unknown function [Promethearchaeota archaeon]|nr:MAG: conserved membrane protein of unknown function [Candidatus Lokiarchaeota archaeon]
MFIFFHLAIPLLIFEIPPIKERISINRFALLIGAVIPDLIDKPLVLLGWGSGRGISHSLLFLIISTSIVFLGEAVQGRKSFLRDNIITISYLTGITIHLLLDIPEVPLFYPFIPYPYSVEGDLILMWLENLFLDPFNLFSELFGIMVIVFIIYKNKLYHFKDLWDYITINQ